MNKSYRHGQILKLVRSRSLRTQDEVARALRTENFVVDLAFNGEDGQHSGDTESYDAVVLDLGLPKVNGVAVLKAWRMAGVNQESSPAFASAILTRKTRDVRRVASQNMGPGLARACAYGASAIEPRAKLKYLRIMTVVLATLG